VDRDRKPSRAFGRTFFIALFLTDGEFHGMNEKQYDFTFKTTLSEEEIKRVMAAIKDALGIKPVVRKASDPLSDCVEKTKKVRSFSKIVHEVVVGPIPVPTPVISHVTCNVYETTVICPGQSPETYQTCDCGGYSCDDERLERV
jgi:hypothetical protein